jgi:hypothetical protein
MDTQTEQRRATNVKHIRDMMTTAIARPPDITPQEFYQEMIKRPEIRAALEKLAKM